jgi:hypothetical protein
LERERKQAITERKRPLARVDDDSGPQPIAELVTEVCQTREISGANRC